MSEADHLSWLDRLRLRRFHGIVELVTHSSVEDRVCAILAGAALAEAVRGTLLENSLGKWVSGKNAVRWARSFAEIVRAGVS